MASWNDLPNEVVEHILSYCCADGLRKVSKQWPGVTLRLFEYNPHDCGIKSECIFDFMRLLQFEKRCRTILKDMCVFKSCINPKTYHNGILKKEWDFKSGILHKKINGLLG